MISSALLSPWFTTIVMVAMIKKKQRCNRFSSEREPSINYFKLKSMIKLLRKLKINFRKLNKKVIPVKKMMTMMKKMTFYSEMQTMRTIS